jgi:DNA-directed RNA polymerase sigma subunit (sigma70/sigma32)
MTEQTITKNVDLSLVNMENAISDIMLHLNEKETEVLTKRFSLNNKPKQTLEKI